MNHALAPSAALQGPSTRVSRTSVLSVEETEDLGKIRRVRSLLALFSLYAVALLSVVTLSDGADVGCILFGIAAHVLYATVRLVGEWREESWLDDARAGVLRRATRRLSIA